MKLISYFITLFPFTRCYCQSLLLPHSWYTNCCCRLPLLQTFYRGKSDHIPEQRSCKLKMPEFSSGGAELFANHQIKQEYSNSVHKDSYWYSSSPARYIFMSKYNIRAYSVIVLLKCTSLPMTNIYLRSLIYIQYELSSGQNLFMKYNKEP